MTQSQDTPEDAKSPKPDLYLANPSEMTLEDIDNLFEALTGRNSSDEDRAEAEAFFEKHIKGDAPFEETEEADDEYR